MAEQARREDQAEKNAVKPGENAALAEEAGEEGSEAAKVLRNEPAKGAVAAAKGDAAKLPPRPVPRVPGGSDEVVASDAKGEAASKVAHAAANAKADAVAAAKAASVEAGAEARGRVDGDQGTGAETGQKTGADTAGSGDAKADANTRAWGTFWSKVRREDADRAGSKAGTDAGAAAKAAHTARPDTAVPFPVADAAATEAAADKVIQRVMEGNPERILRQVEQGVLKNVGQGTKQLTLRLTPPDLGRVHLQIQAREGEVRVLLRAENGDASKVIADNLHHIRQSLEAQGLKVDKLEVQTQLADNQFKEGSWQGAQGHNEMLERHRDMARMSRWRSMHDQSMGVAREMQNVHEQARISSPGIDIIA